MNPPKPLLIRQTIADHLRSIRQCNGYRTDIGSMLQTSSAIPDDEQSVFLMEEIEETSTGRSGGNSLRCESVINLSVDINGWDDAAYARAYDILNDIKRAAKQLISPLLRGNALYQSGRISKCSKDGVEALLIDLELRVEYDDPAD